MEKLHELTESGAYDVVVVDTPPSRNAMDFLDAPRRLTHFLGHRLFQLLLMPTRAYLRAVSVASQALLRAIGKVAGSDVVEDAVAFFQAFEGMEEGFRMRAEHMQRVMRSPDTAYVLVTAPRTDLVTEASWFADRLEESGFAVAALVVNRVQPRFPYQGTLPQSPAGSDLAALEDNLHEMERRFALQETAIASISGRVAPAPVVHVPVLDQDVHDLDGLGAVVDALTTAPASR